MDKGGGEWELSRAALLSGTAARQAWDKARAQLDLENLPPELFPLLPKLYLNLCALGIDDAWRPRLKGIYRQTWSGNQLRLPHLARAGEILGAPVLLPGAAWLVQHYGDAGLCAVHSCDAWLARAPDAAQLDALAKAGWYAEPELNFPAHLITNPAVQRFRQRDENVMLCCHLWAEHDLETEAASSSAPLGSAWRSVSPTVALILLARSGEHNARAVWQTHAAVTTGRIDWTRLANAVREPSHAANLLALLDFLPSDVSATLRATLLYQARGGTRAGTQARLLRAWQVLWQDYPQTSAPRWGYAGYLMQRWGLAHAGQLPAALVRRLVRVMKE